MMRRVRRVVISALAMLVGLGLLPPATGAQASASASGTVIEAQEVRTVWTSEFGVPHPSGLAYIPSRDQLLVVGEQSQRSTLGLLLGFDENLLGTIDLPILDNPSTLVYDPAANRLRWCPAIR
jgi:hypothetical protein